MRSLGGQLTHFFVDLQLFWIAFWARKVSFSAGESKEKIPCIAVRWICIVMPFDYLFTNISCAQTGSTYLVSTHVVWDIICDALPHCSYQNFWFKIPWVPPFKYFRNVGLEYPRSPPRRQWKFGQKDLCGSWCVETNRQGYRLLYNVIEDFIKTVY